MAAADTATPTEPAFDRDTDDLAVSILAVTGQLERLTLADGKLGLVPSDTPTTTDRAVAAAAEYAVAGCKRLNELVHNNHANKTEAIDRDALRHLSEAIQRHDHTSVRVHASKALRSICFKNEEAKLRAKPASVIASLAGALVDIVADIEGVAGIKPAEGSAGISTGTVVASGDASASGGAGGVAHVVSSSARSPKPVDSESFVLVDEVITTITALVNRHEINTLAFVESGGQGGVVRCVAAITAYIRSGAALSIPSSSTAASGAVAGDSPASTAAATGGAGGSKTPAQLAVAAAAGALKKAQFLQMMLEP